MPSSETPQQISTDASKTTQTSTSPPTSNGSASTTNSTSALSVTGTKQLTGAEIKAQKKAEKAARRAQEILNKQVGSAAQVSAGGKVEGHTPGSKGTPKGGKDVGKGQQKHRGSTAGETRNLAIRGVQQTAAALEPRPQDKTVELFRHLYKTRATTIAGAGKEVHPAVLALGQQMRSYVVCGSNARLVATLQAFKRVCISCNNIYIKTLTLPSRSSKLTLHLLGTH